MQRCVVSVLCRERLLVRERRYQASERAAINVIDCSYIECLILRRVRGFRRLVSEASGSAAASPFAAHVVEVDRQLLDGCDSTSPDYPNGSGLTVQLPFVTSEPC